MTLIVSPTGFKHTGVFPEQAVNWAWYQEKIRQAGRPIRVLNLFGYTGGATLACLAAGASVTHVDASKGMVQWARENAEASGIALATICAQKYGVPMIFAKKAKSDNIEGGLYQSEIFSYTYKKKVTLLVAQDWLKPEDKVLIIDDFMAKGCAVHGLIDIVEKAGAQLKGIGIAVEKGFQGGGDRLRAAGVNLKSLAIIESAEPGNIVFRDDD